MADLENWGVLRSLFPPWMEQIGQNEWRCEALARLCLVGALLRTLLMHVGCGWSLRETAVRAKLAGIADVSDVTLLNRLRDSESWLRLLCQQLWQENGVQLQSGFHGRILRLLDATVVKEPGQTGSQWRIHYSLRLPTLECDCFDLTSTRGRRPESGLGVFVFSPTNWCWPMRATVTLPASRPCVEQQADLCVRLNPHALPLWNAVGEPFSSAGGFSQNCAKRERWLNGRYRFGREKLRLRGESVRSARAESRSASPAQTGDQAAKWEKA